MLDALCWSCPHMVPHAARPFDNLRCLLVLQLGSRHPTEGGYPLRPELMESTFLLYSATHDPRLLKVSVV